MYKLYQNAWFESKSDLRLFSINSQYVLHFISWLYLILYQKSGSSYKTYGYVSQLPKIYYLVFWVRWSSFPILLTNCDILLGQWGLLVWFLWRQNSVNTLVFLKDKYLQFRLIGMIMETVKETHFTITKWKFSILKFDIIFSWFKRTWINHFFESIF